MADTTTALPHICRPAGSTRKYRSHLLQGLQNNKREKKYLSKLAAKRNVRKQRNLEFRVCKSEKTSGDSCENFSNFYWSHVHLIFEFRFREYMSTTPGIVLTNRRCFGIALKTRYAMV